jgi:hypothetical protein
MFNELNTTQAQREIGVAGLNELRQLGQWLFGAPPSFAYRYAPSIIARGEAELFGISIPRFAIRAYPKNGQGELVKGAFFNARRLETFGKHAGEHVATVLRQESCLADCLVPLPRRLLDVGYQAIHAPVSVAYGESRPAGPGQREPPGGTPFLRPIRMAGGGLCAQAICFMAATLLHDYARGVHSLPEITRMARGRHRPQLKISGLDLMHVARYLTEAGLHARIQRGGNCGAHRSHHDAFEFANALRAYVRSGMPVIVPVDLGRLRGEAPAAYRKEVWGAENEPGELSEEHAWNPLECVYARNFGKQWSAPRSRTPRRSRTHAVILVGWRPESDDFLLNDPACLPFLEASASELDAAGPYAPGLESPRLRNQIFLPVTPPKARLLLHHWCRLPDIDRMVDEEHDHGATWHHGLFFVLTTLQSPEGAPAGLPRMHPVEPDSAFRDLTLMPASQLALAGFRTRDAEQDAIKPLGLDCQERLRRDHRWKEDHWIWVQNTRNSIWIFDAEQKLPASLANASADAQSGFLRAIIHRAVSGNRWLTWYP